MDVTTEATFEFWPWCFYNENGTVRVHFSCLKKLFLDSNYFDNDFIMRNVQNATEFFVLFWREQFLVERVGTL